VTLRPLVDRGETGRTGLGRITMDCDGITKTARRCGRRASYAYGAGVLSESGEFQGYRTVAGYCAQHHRGAGVMRLLRPLVWEFDIIRRIGADGSLGETVDVVSMRAKGWRP
jgi:hypothetical protein